MPDWLTGTDWLTGLVSKANGWSVVVLLLIGAVARELIPAWIKWRGANLEERKYNDSEAKMAREALVEELRQQVKKLVVDVQNLTKLHMESASAHVHCQIEQEKLRGEMNVMKVEMDRLKNHERANVDNVKGLQQIVATIDPSSAAKLIQ